MVHLHNVVGSHRKPSPSLGSLSRVGKECYCHPLHFRQALSTGSPGTPSECFTSSKFLPWSAIRTKVAKFRSMNISAH
ncbi:hypothetical protein HMPREF9374_3831 [Desmospora sp. 8437]|nr:hypothetical protein HMPREF9374_3831 [Desmospora sp. 8437]